MGKHSIIKRVAVMCVVAALALASLAAGREKPNVIFILADDLGYGDTGFTWQSRAREASRARILTPNLDRLARDGATMTSHYCAAPVCAPSRASLLLGRVQGRCSLRDNCFDQPFAERDTLGTVMKGAGYATWAVGKWGIAGGGESGKPVSSHPLDKGFDYFYGFLDHMAGHTYYHYEGHIRGAFMGITENRTNATASAEGIYSTDLFAAKTKELISAHLAREPEKPFFLYLAVNAIHGSGQSGDSLANKTPLHVPGRPYPESGVSWPLEKEPAAARNTWINPAYADLPPFAARYATAITRMDDAIGDVVRHLERCGIAEDTLIVFTSDNGPADEYGADPRFFGSAGPFDGLKRDVFEGGMRVPALAHWPARIRPGTVDAAPSQSHDWMATLADVVGAEKPGSCDGVSLLPRWEGKKGEPSLVYTQYEFPWGGGTEAFNEFRARKGAVRGLQQMVRAGDYVALRTRMREGGDGAKVRLYNVVEDPFQTRDLAGDEAQRTRLAELTKILDDRLNRGG
jgi:arylsulfatase A-like enzyme